MGSNPAWCTICRNEKASGRRVWGFFVVLGLSERLRNDKRCSERRVASNAEFERPRTTRCQGVQGDMQMMQGYPKPWQSYRMQLDLLMVRGMVVTDASQSAGISGAHRLLPPKRLLVCIPRTSLSSAAHSINKLVQSQPGRSRLDFRSTVSSLARHSRTQSTCTSSIRNCDC